MRFADPSVGYVLLAAFAAALLARCARRRHCFAHSLAHQAIVADLHPSHMRLLPAAIRGLAAIVAGLALMDPRIASRDRFSRFEGLDIVMVVDLSSSMLEALGGYDTFRKQYEAWAAKRTLAERERDRDQIPMPQTRLEAVRAGLAEFVSKRTQDRVALIAFSENTYIISPLTTDHRYVDKYVHMIDGTLLIGEGVTSIGDGVATAMGMFQRDRDPETRNKVIIVFTDGENNHGRDPLEVLSEARYYGYRIYMIGVDIGPEVTRKPSVRQLIAAIENTGGRYFDALDGQQLEDAYRTIDHTEKGVLAQRTVERDVPVYPWFAALALLLVAVAAILDATPYFIDIS